MLGLRRCGFNRFGGFLFREERRDFPLSGSGAFKRLRNIARCCRRFDNGARHDFFRHRLWHRNGGVLHFRDGSADAVGRFEVGGGGDFLFRRFFVGLHIQRRASDLFALRFFLVHNNGWRRFGRFGPYLRLRLFLRRGSDLIGRCLLRRFRSCGEPNLHSTLNRPMSNRRRRKRSPVSARIRRFGRRPSPKAIFLPETKSRQRTRWANASNRVFAHRRLGKRRDLHEKHGAMKHGAGNIERRIGTETGVAAAH